MGRVAILVATSAVMIGALGGCGHGTSTAPGTGPAGAAAPAPVAPTVHVISITVRGGKATGETGRIMVPLGTPVVVSVASDVADQIHVQGYDRKAKVPAGTTASVTLIANKPGVYGVELEGSKLQLAQLQVG